MRQIPQKIFHSEEKRISISLQSDNFDLFANMMRSFTGHYGSPRGFWTLMHHISDLSWPEVSYPVYTRIERVVKLKDRVRKKKKNHMSFFETEFQFSLKLKN